MSDAALPTEEPATGAKRVRTESAEEKAQQADSGLCVWVIHGMDGLDVWEFDVRHFGAELPAFSRFAFLVSRQNSRLEVSADSESDDGTSSETTRCDAEGDPLHFMAAIQRFCETLRKLNYTPSKRDEWERPARVVVSLDWE
jgi:hypothetical protein